MIPNPRILVIDDEKNLRASLVTALQALGARTEAVATGEEGLDRILAASFDLVFLDLRLPGLDGLEVLRRARAAAPGLRVVVISAHGTVDSAVEAMKLGAVDFLQKPFGLAEVRELARSLLDPALVGEEAASYPALVEEARRLLVLNQVGPALVNLRRAVGSDPGRPEAFNLLGAAMYASGRPFQAQDYFRAALALDPTYRPARENLERLGGVGTSMARSPLNLGA